MADVVNPEAAAAAERVATIYLLNRVERAAGEPDPAAAGYAAARKELLARIVELEKDRELLERLARMDSITLGSRVGSPIRKWEAPRLQRPAALRAWLETLPPTVAP